MPQFNIWRSHKNASATYENSRKVITNMLLIVFWTILIPINIRSGHVPLICASNTRISRTHYAPVSWHESATYVTHDNADGSLPQTLSCCGPPPVRRTTPQRRQTWWRRCVLRHRSRWSCRSRPRYAPRTNSWRPLQRTPQVTIAYSQMHVLSLNIYICR